MVSKILVLHQEKCESFKHLGKSEDSLEISYDSKFKEFEMCGIRLKSVT